MDVDPALVTENLKLLIGDMMLSIAKLQVQVRVLTAENEQLKHAAEKPEA